MARTSKYIHFTDTEISDLITNFTQMLCFVEYEFYEKYLNDFHGMDLVARRYNQRELCLFLATIIDFIVKKKNKLRVRTDLKLNKVDVISLIFGDMNMSAQSKDLQFWVATLLDFYFSKYDIFEHIDNMEQNYVAMYDEYLKNYDISNMNK